MNQKPTPEIDCEIPGNEARGEYLLRLKNWYESEDKEWNEKKNAYDQAKKAYDNISCSDTEYLDKKSRCDDTLRGIENNACSYAQGHKIQCLSHRWKGTPHVGEEQIEQVLQTQTLQASTQARPSAQSGGSRY